jgi:hypothetical protein
MVFVFSKKKDGVKIKEKYFELGWMLLIQGYKVLGTQLMLQNTNFLIFKEI